MSAAMALHNLELLISGNSSLRGSLTFEYYHFKATTLDEQALTYQYLEWRAQNVHENRLEKCVLEELNQIILPRAFLTGSRLTAVDLLLASDLRQSLAAPMDFQNKFILAPMVRISTHPMRLIALRYGADYVFSEELIDQRVIRSKRVVNDNLNTIDFILPDGTVTFRTSPEERGRVIAQLGTAKAESALEAARLLENDVTAIDVNMGCPKEFSMKGGMGAALLKKPDQVKSILTALTSNLRVPVTCKIRILPELEDTIQLVRLIESTGVAAITVHGRTIQERPQHRNHDEVIREIAKALSIPVIANGGSKDTITKYEDIEFFRQQTGASSVMIARAAMWYPAIFCPPNDEGSPPPLHDIIREYLVLAMRYGHHINGAKYCIQQMLHREGDTPLFLDTLAAVDLEQLCSVWGVLDKCREAKRHKAKLRAVQDHTSLQSDSELSETKRSRLDANEHGADSDQLITYHIPFERRYWPIHGITPKQILIAYCQKQKIKPPDFHTIEERGARLFFSTATINNIRYHNTFGCKSKKFSEQAVSLVCLKALGIPDGRLPTNT
ncbi:tRNA-dihydrouridine(20) synthase (NAD(P)+) [Fasciola hepatica]|uniref:tRNA-dihydrouridine(20) synthase (NAD(P)+) n=1 Tax=Fasciola hepatica TaxID=6192 RepID=A0A4E0RJW2_FASHE|nr:tRNA-dihydrouridine(20) synthase (NAD(P)+) [Fasciola hepatica]